MLGAVVTVRVPVMVGGPGRGRVGERGGVIAAVRDGVRDGVRRGVRGGEISVGVLIAVRHEVRVGANVGGGPALELELRIRVGFMRSVMGKCSNGVNKY